MSGAERVPIVAGNWKMHMNVGEAIDLAAEVKRATAEIDGVEIVLCPPHTALKSVGDLVRYSKVALGAQNMHWADRGAYTGEISPGMLRDLGCGYVILGHSERRQHFGETDEGVNRKVKAAVAAGLRPIVCVGETRDQREGGRTETVVEEQVRGALAGLDSPDELVIAYEPVWAIGTGLTATPEQAQECHAFIRGLLVEIAGKAAAEATRIQYGGSMKPANAAELLALPDVDGGLIGGAALEAGSFVEIVQAAG